MGLTFLTCLLFVNVRIRQSLSPIGGWFLLVKQMTADSEPNNAARRGPSTSTSQEVHGCRCAGCTVIVFTKLMRVNTGPTEHISHPPGSLVFADMFVCLLINYQKFRLYKCILFRLTQHTVCCFGGKPKIPGELIVFPSKFLSVAHQHETSILSRPF